MTVALLIFLIIVRPSVFSGKHPFISHHSIAATLLSPVQQYLVPAYIDDGDSAILIPVLVTCWLADWLAGWLAGWLERRQ